MNTLTIARPLKDNVTELVRVESKWPPEDKEYKMIQERMEFLEKVIQKLEGEE